MVNKIPVFGIRNKINMLIGFSILMVFAAVGIFVLEHLYVALTIFSFLFILGIIIILTFFKSHVYFNQREKMIQIYGLSKQADEVMFEDIQKINITFENKKTNIILSYNAINQDVTFDFKVLLFCHKKDFEKYQEIILAWNEILLKSKDTLTDG